MKYFSLIAAAFAALVVCSNAQAKDYQAAEAPGGPGYFNLIDQGFWVVGYTGEPGQSQREISEYALKRAADLTAEQNKEWFAVLQTTDRMVTLGVADDLQTRAGSFMGGGSSAAAGVGSGGPPVQGNVGNSGNFGGDAVPNAVLERWQPRRVRQTILVVEMRSGADTSFPGLAQTPEIHPATGRATAP